MNPGHHEYGAEIPTVGSLQSVSYMKIKSASTYNGCGVNSDKCRRAQRVDTDKRNCVKKRRRAEQARELFKFLVFNAAEMVL